MLIPENDFREISNNLPHSLYQREINSLKNCLNIILLPFLFVLGSTLILLIINIFIKNIHSNNNKNDLYNYNRVLNEEFILNDSYKNIVNFLNNVSQITFKGNWNSNDINKKSGIIFIQILPTRVFYPEFININFRILKNKYIDNWICLYNKIRINNLQIENNTNNLIFEGNFLTEEEKGKVFERKEYNPSCICNININFNKKNNILITNEINGKINCSSCTIKDIEFNGDNKSFYIQNKTINNYSFLITFICICVIINTHIISYSLNNSESYSNSISLITVYENIIWNSYGCLMHFYLTINYKNYFYQFLIPTFCFFFNLSLTDIRFIYYLWRLKNIRNLNDTNLIRRKLTQLYVVFYLIMFFSLFFLIKIYFNKIFALIGISLTWLPQIIFNAIYNNKILMPFSYLILISIYRLFIPIYFRIYDDNFFFISPDYKFVFFALMIIIISILFLYIQIFYDSRFFLPKKFKKSIFDFYKTKQELIEINKNYEKIDCVICLNPLFNEENIEYIKYFENNFVALGENENVQIIYEKKNFNSSLKKFLINIKNVILSCFKFQEKNLNLYKKNFMLTPCKHVFHTKCLETWFLRKKECPNCRSDIYIF